MPKLSAPVGLSPRTSEGKPTKNADADIITLRMALRANGFMVAETGKVDAGLMKAITDAQKKAGLKDLDQVVDPDGPTWKYLFPKYDAAEKAALKVKLYKITYAGKTYYLEEKPYEELSARIFKDFGVYASSIEGKMDINLKVTEGYHETAQLKDGYLAAVSLVVVLKAGNVKLPNTSLAMTAMKAVTEMKKATIQKDMVALSKTVPAAEAAVNAFCADVDRFLREFQKSATVTLVTLKVTSAAGWAVVGCIAAPVLVTGLGMSALGATIASGAAIAGIQSATDSTCKLATGQKGVTTFGEIKKVVIDTTVGAATAGVAAKLPLGFVKTQAGRLAPVLISKLPSEGVKLIGAKGLETFLVKYLTASGESVIKGAVTEAIALLGKTLNTGKAPTMKDLEDSTQKVLLGLLTAGLLNRMAAGQKKWVMDCRKSLEGKLFPDALAKFAKDANLPSVLKAKVYADAFAGVTGAAVDGGIAGMMELAKGDEDANKLVALAKTTIEKDAGLKKKIEDEMVKALKKNNVEVK